MEPVAGTSQDLDAARAFYTRISSLYDALADKDEHRARELPDDTIPLVLRDIRRTLRPGGRLAVVSMDTGTDDQRRAAPERIYVWMRSSRVSPPEVRGPVLESLA